VLLMLPVVTAPAAYAALVYVTHRQQTQTHIDLNDFWHGFRTRFGRSLFLGVINAVVFAILLVNFSSYAPGQGAFFGVLRVAWAIILILWLCIQLYAWPLLEMMDAAQLSTPMLVLVALRNATLMLFKNPAYTVVMMVVIGLWTAFCSLLLAPVAMFLFAMVANVAVGATRDRLDTG
jgi:uncharacterized membrane protein YesL